MPSGYEAYGVCYPTQGAAAAAWAAHQPVVQYTHGSCTYFTTFVWERGQQIQQGVFQASANAATCPPSYPAGIKYVSFAAPACVTDSNPFFLSVEDGALIAGAVAAVWVSAWCLKALARALNTDGTPEKEIS